MHEKIDPSEPFLASLLAVMDRKDHPAWPHFAGPEASVDDLELHYRQEFAVYVRDFPVFLGRVHCRCPHAEVRRELAENLFEEETGGISGTGPHPELFLRMMEGLGIDRGRFQEVDLLPAAAAYRAWLDEITTRRHWLVGAAVVTLFVEGSVNDRREVEGNPMPPRPVEEDPLVRFHGVDPELMTLKVAHSQVEGAHRQSAWGIVAGYATTTARRRSILHAMETTLRLWHVYRDAVAEACGLAQPATG
jgi:pyrroloquinoline quinone (PQQ) biosynthesis protein C